MSNLQAQAEAIANQYLSEGLPARTDYAGRVAELADATTLTKLFNAIADGNYPTVAARLAGISYDTYHRWMKRGEAEPNSAYASFANAIKEAECEAEANIVADVRKAARDKQFWAAGMTLLERRHPEKWGRRQESESGPKVQVIIGAGAQQVQIAVVSPPTFAPDSTIEDSAKSLTGSAFALPSSPITALMVTNAEACQVQTTPLDRQLPAVEPTGGPTPAGRRLLQPKRVTGGQRAARKKKGHVA